MLAKASLAAIWWKERREDRKIREVLAKLFDYVKFLVDLHPLTDRVTRSPRKRGHRGRKIGMSIRPVFGPVRGFAKSNVWSELLPRIVCSDAALGTGRTDRLMSGAAAFARLGRFGAMNPMCVA